MTRARSKSKRARRGGYTLIEVMMGVGIMTFGAVGIMALQQATLRGNREAREITTATQITRTWLDRVRRDSLQWTVRGVVGTAATDYLQAVPALPTAAGTWATPVPPVAPPAVGGEGVAFDYFGRDVAPANAYFCTNLRMRWAIANQAIRVDARTWWHRTNAYGDRQIHTNCDIGNEAGITGELDSATPRLHAVYGSTLVRWSQRR